MNFNFAGISKSDFLFLVKQIVAIIFLVLCFESSYAQGVNEWTVRPGESIKEALGDSVIYKYPRFTQGIVYFRYNSISHALLDLNLYTGEMEFITPEGDTLAIANPETVKYITIQSDTFYFDKVYIELLHGNSEAKLGQIQTIKLSDIKREGGYGQMLSTAAVNTSNSYYSNNQTYKLTEKTQLALHKQTVFFIGDSFNHFLPYNKKNVYKMFNTKESAVNSFVKENKIQFDKRDDLVKLVDFIGKI